MAPDAAEPRFGSVDGDGTPERSGPRPRFRRHELARGACIRHSISIDVDVSRLRPCLDPSLSWSVLRPATRP